MISLLQPAGLWLMAGMVVPILIHLWNKRQGKILQVGSVLLLQQSSRQQARQVQLKHLLLLLLRCLLIGLLAILLARPVFNVYQLGRVPKGWLLIPAGQVNNAYRQYQQRIDSLLANGYDFHYFNNGFEKATFTSALNDTVVNREPAMTDYWQTIALLNQQVDQKLAVQVFTDAQQVHFRGRRPQVNMALQWNAITAADSVATFITGSYPNNKGAITAIIETSMPGGNNIAYKNMQPPILAPGFNVVKKNGSQLLMFTDSPGHKSEVPLDTTARNFIIYTDQFTADARYVSSAINALLTFTGMYGKVQLVNDVNKIADGADWLFWLSEQTMPRGLNAKHYWQYATGGKVNQPSWLTSPQKNITQGHRINLYKIIMADASVAVLPVWTNGFGLPVLAQKQGAPNHYLFYSRFNPQWSALVWSSQFPAIMQSILFKQNQSGTHVLDKRVMLQQQILPAKTSTKITATLKAQQNDGSRWLLVVIFLLFVMERMVSFSQKKEGGLHAA